MSRTTSTTTARKYRCDDCLPLWDRSGNVKGISLCELHAAAPVMQTLLEEVIAPRKRIDIYKRIRNLLTELEKEDAS